MTASREEFEAIVAEVIRRLRLLDPAQPQAAQEPSAAGGRLVLADRLVTLRTMEGKLQGVSRVVVPARAVVTPAARDELKQRRIELVREAAP